MDRAVLGGGAGCWDGHMEKSHTPALEAGIVRSPMPPYRLSARENVRTKYSYPQLEKAQWTGYNVCFSGSKGSEIGAAAAAAETTHQPASAVLRPFICSVGAQSATRDPHKNNLWQPDTPRRKRILGYGWKVRQQRPTSSSKS